MALQSNEEILRIWDEWGRNFAPTVAPGLLLNQKNAELLSHYIFSHDGVMSISGLNAAVKVLSAQLEWAPQKSANQIAIEKAAEDDARMRKDYFESLREADTQKVIAKKADDVRALAAVKELARLKGEIDTTINSYVAGHPSGHTDFGRTARGHEIMRRVLSRYTSRTPQEAAVALEAVRAAKARLP